MSKAPVVIRVAGRAKRANLDGETIERESKIFVRSYGGWFETLDTYDHFVYYQKHYLGATMMCTCGSDAGIYNYDVYKRFDSTYKGQVIACNSLMQFNHHSDGSNS